MRTKMWICYRIRWEKRRSNENLYQTRGGRFWWEQEERMQGGKVDQIWVKAKGYGSANLSKSEEKQGYGSAGDLVPRLPPPTGQGGEGEKQRSGCHHKRSLFHFLIRNWITKGEIHFHQSCTIINIVLFKIVDTCSFWLATTPIPLQHCPIVSRNWFDFTSQYSAGLSTLPTLIEKSPLKGED